MKQPRTPLPRLANAQPAESAVAELRFLNARQVAEYLQINEKKVYALAAEGRIPGTKVTGKWLFPRDLVDQWLVESSHGGVLTDRLVLAGSDDPLLHRVVSLLATDIGARALIAYTATGTGLGLSLLAARRADGCALHWGPAAESDVRHPALIQRFQGHSQWVIVRGFRREQGLMLQRDRSAHDLSVGALASGSTRWVFRQEGSGSQRFLQETLAEAGIEPASLSCTATAHSEREAASLVAMGEADVAPGIRAAANECGLGFLPVGEEAFDLALPREIYFRTLFQRLLDTLKSDDLRAVATQLGGYDLAEAGKMVWAQNP